MFHVEVGTHVFRPAGGSLDATLDLQVRVVGYWGDEAFSLVRITFLLSVD